MDTCSDSYPSCAAKSTPAVSPSSNKGNGATHSLAGIRLQVCHLAKLMPFQGSAVTMEGGRHEPRVRRSGFCCFSITTRLCALGQVSDLSLRESLNESRNDPRDAFQALTF